MKLRTSDIQGAVTAARLHSGLTKSAFAEVVGTSRSAMDEIEKGKRVPRVDTFIRVLEAAGFALDRPVIPARQLGERLSLAQFIDGIEGTDPAWLWRTLVSDFVANEYVPATRVERQAMLAEEPRSIGSTRWDSFVGALAEHLGFHAEVNIPKWTTLEGRNGVESFWWPVHGDLPTSRATALAMSPAAFKRRRILIDGSEIPEVVT